MKIIDPDQQWSTEEPGTLEHCSLVFFSKRFEDLPICTRIGDIIRVHRANVGVFKNTKQFTSNIFFNSSWALFSAVNPLKDKEEHAEQANEVVGKKTGAKNDPREFMPFAYYGKTFSFEQPEKKIINSQRDFIAKNFPKSSVLSNRYITPLKDVPEQGKKRENGKYYDFDVQGKIVQLFKLD